MYSSVRGRVGIVSYRSYFGHSILLTRFSSTTRVEDYGDGGVLISGTGRARRRGGCLFADDVSDAMSRRPWGIHASPIRTFANGASGILHRNRLYTAMLWRRTDGKRRSPNTRYCTAAFHRFLYRSVLVFNAVTLFDGNRTKTRLVTSGDVLKLYFSKNIAVFKHSNHDKYIRMSYTAHCLNAGIHRVDASPWRTFDERFLCIRQVESRKAARVCGYRVKTHRHENNNPKRTKRRKSKEVGLYTLSIYTYI